MRALITGGNGFVGRWLAAHLRAQGDDVTVIDIEVDVGDPSQVGPAITRAQPDAIYHLAALSHVGDSWVDPTAVLTVNVIGTAAVLAGARALDKPAKVLVISSAEVYGHVGVAALPLTESSAVLAVSPYAVSKAAAEQVALGACRAYGQEVIIVRPFNHVGPGQAPTFVVSALAKRIIDAKRSGATELVVGNLSTRRDFTDVRDVVRVYRSLIEHGVSGEIYNVCSGTDVAIDDVARRLIELSEFAGELTVDPELFRPVDVPVLRGSAAKVHAATGWEPVIDLDTTLRDVLDYWSQS